MPNWHTSHHKPPRTRSCSQAALTFCKSVSNTTNMETFPNKAATTRLCLLRSVVEPFCKQQMTTSTIPKPVNHNASPSHLHRACKKTCKKGNGNCAIISLSKLEYSTSPVAPESRNGAWIFLENSGTWFSIECVLPGESAGVRKKKTPREGRRGSDAVGMAMAPRSKHLTKASDRKGPPFPKIT